MYMHYSIFINPLAHITPIKSTNRDFGICQGHVSSNKLERKLLAVMPLNAYFSTLSHAGCVRRRPCCFSKQQFVLHNYRTSDNKTLIYAQQKEYCFCFELLIELQNITQFSVKRSQKESQLQFL